MVVPSRCSPPAAPARASAAAPGLLKHDFGFAGWLGHVPARWRRLCDEARQVQHAAPDEQHPRIHVYEPDLKRLGRARRHAKALGLEAWVQWHDQGAWKMKPPAASGVLLVCPSRDDSAQQAAVEHAARSRFEGWQVVHRSESGETQGRAWRGKAQQVLKVSRGKRNMQVQLFDLSTHTRPVEVSPAPRQPVAETVAVPAVEPAPDLINRLGKNHKHLRRWALREGVDCYRLYDADMPEFALAIDIYEGRVHVQEYAAPKSVDERAARERLAEALAVIPEALGVEPEDMVCKQRQRQTGTNQYEKQAVSGEFFRVHEHGCVLKVNLKDYLDTGLFLDHRPVRHWIQQHSANQRFLNLFCYTGAATVHAVVGGASRSLSLDMSKTYVGWAEENLALNGADPKKHRVEQADCLAWLADRKTADQRFDLIFMDPPTFSNSARMAGVLDIQKDHPTLVRQAMARLSSDGLLIFSNNFRRFKLDETLESEFEVAEVTRDTLDKDFQRNTRIHRCWHIRHKA